VAALVIAVALPLIAHATHMRRLAANFAKWDSTEFSTTGGTSSPLNFYTKTVTVPAATGNNVIYVTLSTAGDGHDGAALLLRCRVDGVPCNGGSTFTGGAGWIVLQKIPDFDADSNNCNDGGGGGADCHDNSFTYTWCKAVLAGSRTVKLDLASSNGGVVFMEGTHVYIDSNSIPSASNACTPF